MSGSCVMLVALAVLAGVKAQVLLEGACPIVPVQRNFSPDKFLGTWYEIERFYNDADVNSRCTRVEFTSNPDGRIGLLSTSLQERTGRPLVSYGVATFDYGELSRMVVRYLPQVYSAGTREMKYWILDTDYTSYAVVFSCRDLCRGDQHSENVWILGRAAVVPQQTLNYVYRLLKTTGISPKRLMKVDQQRCVNVAVSVRSEDPQFSFDRSSARNFLASLVNGLRR